MTVNEMNEKKIALGYSYEQISKLSGVPESTVRKVLGGKTKAPRYATLQALSKVFEDVTEKKKPSVPYSDTIHYHSTLQPLKISEALPSYGAAKKQGEYTLDDYFALPDDVRVELIDGVIYDMATPTGFHQLIAGKLHAMILSWISGRKGKCMPFIAPIGVQLDCDNRTWVEPDILILCDKDKYTRTRIFGAPDFVAEILSPSTRKKDIFIKLNKYRNAGVREYWIIDPDKKNVMVWNFEDDDAVMMYSFRDKIPMGIYNGELVIDFSEIDDYVTPWM